MIDYRFILSKWLGAPSAANAVPARSPRNTGRTSVHSHPQTGSRIIEGLLVRVQSGEQTRGVQHPDWVSGNMKLAENRADQSCCRGEPMPQPARRWTYEEE